MSATSIEWTDVTWNPTRGCSRVSEGCRNCYAERQAARNFPGLKSPTTGESFAVLTDSGPRWTGKLELIEAKLVEPLHWKKPRRVFVNSMSDLFHEDLPDEAIDRVFAVMALCPQHTFQVLTKRADRMRQWMPRDPFTAFERLLKGGNAGINHWPLPNVWLGVSVEDQANKYRIDLLRQTPAAIRFLSIEPLLEDIGQLDLTGIHWVIVGGESGPGARPIRPEWVRAVRDQCQAANVPFFFKQWGEWAPVSNFVASPQSFAEMRKVGKKAAGAILDGREWREFPANERTSHFNLSAQPPFNNKKARR